MARIEYKTVVLTHGTMGVSKGKFNRGALTTMLQDEGNQGWELIWVVPNASLHQEKDAHLLVFKRPAP